MEVSRLYSTSLVEPLSLRNSSLLPTTGVEIGGKLNTIHKSAICYRCLTKNTAECTDVYKGTMVRQLVSRNGRGAL